MQAVDIGDYIEIPAWNTGGMVVGISSAIFGPDNDIMVDVQQDPCSEDTKRFRVSAGQFEIL